MAAACKGLSVFIPVEESVYRSGLQAVSSIGHAGSIQDPDGYREERQQCGSGGVVVFDLTHIP